MTDNERIKRYVEEQDWSWWDKEPDPFMYVMGLDPGGTTGVAMLRIDTRDDEINPEVVYLHQIKNGLHGFKDFFKYTRVQGNVIIVSEKWKERNRKGADRTPQYIEGAMHMLWDDSNIEYQYPEVKEQVPDQWLKDNNLWTESHRHQMDALKHAFAYLRNSGHSATVKGLSGLNAESMAAEGDAEAAQLEDDGQTADEAFDDAKAALMAAIAEAADAMDAMAGEFVDGTPTGPSGNYEKPANADEYEHKEDTRKRGRRELNGAFSGFTAAEDDEGSVTLFDD